MMQSQMLTLKSMFGIFWECKVRHFFIFFVLIFFSYFVFTQNAQATPETDIQKKIENENQPHENQLNNDDSNVHEYFTSDNRLRLFLNDTVLAVNSSGNFIATKIDSDVIEKQYDDENRLLKVIRRKEFTVKPFFVQTYSYHEGERLPVQIEYIDYEKKNKKIENYTLLGQLIKREEYSFLYSDDGIMSEGKLLRSYHAEYDTKNRIVTELTTEITKNNLKNKTVYEYTKEKGQYLVFYYENNILRKKTEYVNSDKIKTRVYFPHEQSVEKLYDKGILIKEVFYNGKTIQRETEW